MALPPPRPPFSALPLDPKGPVGNAWGLYGESDNLGALNMLTPAVVASAAASEIRTGERVSLDWSLDKPSHPSFDRPSFQHHKWMKKHPDGSPKYIHDDFISFNTQCSSQWDGFRHYGYQKAKKFYNGANPEDLDDPQVIGIDAWVEKGGIVGRGVLLDYPTYCKKHGLPVLNAFDSTSIPLSTLQAIAQDQGVSFQTGDILFVRVGFTTAYDALTPDEQKAIPERPEPNFLGVSSTSEVLRWIWESGFSAVASDAPSFEQAPIVGAHNASGTLWKDEPWEAEMLGGGLLHQWLLAGWGCPIGEMFDLEALSRKCQELGRWTFFVSSVPLKVRYSIQRSIWQLVSNGLINMS